MVASHRAAAAVALAGALTAASAAPALSEPREQPRPELHAQPLNRLSRIHALETAQHPIKQHHLSEVAGDLNRSTRSGCGAPKGGFCWNAGDTNTSKWVPQGITHGDSGWLASWHSGKNEPKQSRVTLVDNARQKYRHVVLADPGKGPHADFEPVPAHAGGIAQVGHYLYVADSGKGVRVFDLNHVWKADGGKSDGRYTLKNGKIHAAGYAWVLPQVGSYTAVREPSKACQAGKNPFFSSVSLDRKSGRLVSGEFCRDGRGSLARWGLRPDGLLDTQGRSAQAAEWYSVPFTSMQGVATRGDAVAATTSNGSHPGVWRTTSLAGKHNGETLGNGKSRRMGPRSPEDVTFAGGHYWTLTEHQGARYVFPSG